MEASLITCPVDAWFNCYAPSRQPWNDGATKENPFIDKINNELRSCRNNQGWNSFHDAGTPIQPEYTTPSLIAELAKNINDTAQDLHKELEPTLSLLASPRTLGTSEVVGYQLHDSNLPKALVAPKEYSSIFSDTLLLSKENAVIARFNLSDGSADDELKLFDAATALMCNDPRRCYVMGFAIEHDQMRLWYFCRSHICVSEAFDFREEPKPFIRFLLTILFATQTELGYDPTITHRTIQNDAGEDVIAYQYKVDDTYYLTQGHPLSDYAASRIVSRATRVWIVKKMVMGANGWTNKLEAKEYILKDVWLFDDALLESEIKAAIFVALKKKDKAKRTTHAADAEPYFMTLTHDWKVESEHLPPRDCTPSVPEGWKPTQYSRQHQALAAQWTVSIDALQVSAPVTAPLKRIHVRTVFEEVCQTLGKIADYKTVMDYFNQIVQALRYMHLAGFVHRDISPGNCMWHAPTGQAKISDLEYARSFSELSGHDPRTGTPSFMAAEYQAQRHFFLKPGVLNMENDVSPPEFFTFNFYHDLESVFWLYTWFIHKCPPAELVLLDGAQTALAQSYTTYLDCGITGNMVRGSIVYTDSGAISLARPLAKVYGSRSFLLNALESVNIIRNAYKALEATEPRLKDGQPMHWQEENFRPQVYDELCQCFRNIRDKLAELQDDVPVQLPSMKRIADAQADPTIKPTNAKKAKKSK
ncbi:hypothetical protein C8R47DRAFT_1323353 [Mycena vitilis]|nr:hypothetical protein C8R47DRAFT_1323353 [Mycena vitilis]